MTLKVRHDLVPIKKPPPPLSAESVYELFKHIRIDMGLPVRDPLPEELEQFEKDREKYYGENTIP